MEGQNQDGNHHGNETNSPPNPASGASQQPVCMPQTKSTLDRP